MNRIAIPLALLLVLASFGCADPAADKPKAEVEEAAPVPAAAEPVAETRRYTLTDATTIGFIGSKVTGSHDGGFRAFEGTIEVNGGDPTRSRMSVTIDTTSLWADNDRLTGHLKSPDFFDVEKFPKATFTSTAIVASGDAYSITGNLDLHGVTKSVTFPAQITLAEDRVTAQAEFAIKRFEFGIEYPGKTDDLIRDDVVIKLDVVAEPAA